MRPIVLFVVLYTLTSQRRELPVNRFVRIYMTVQLHVECSGGTYKIFIAGYAAGDGTVIPKAEVYDSSTNEWSTLSSGLLVGRYDHAQEG